MPSKSESYLLFIPGQAPIRYEPNGAGFTYYDLAGRLVYTGRRDAERVIAKVGRDGFLVTWIGELTPQADGSNVFATYAARTNANGVPSAIYSWDTTGYFEPVQLIGNDVLAASVLLSRTQRAGSGRLFDFEAALVDLKSGTVAPLRELSVFDAGTGAGTENINPILVGIVNGPVLRVISGTDCLNIRKSPDVASKSLGCFADGVLLNDLKETKTIGAITWRKVSPPAGGPFGWVSSEFLR